MSKTGKPPSSQERLVDKTIDCADSAATKLTADALVEAELANARVFDADNEPDFDTGFDAESRLDLETGFDAVFKHDTETGFKSHTNIDTDTGIHLSTNPDTAATFDSGDSLRETGAQTEDSSITESESTLNFNTDREEALAETLADAIADSETGPLMRTELGDEPDIGSDYDEAADAEIGAKLDAALNSTDRAGIGSMLNPDQLAKLESELASNSAADGSLLSEIAPEIEVDEERFWQALQSEDGVLTLHKNGAPSELDTEKAYSIFQKPVDLTEDLSDLSPQERDHRRQALRSMLDASEARQQRAMRKKPPVLAIGAVVRITSGPFQDQQGTILDADFIHSRALIDLQEENDSQWVEFQDIGFV